MMIQRPSDYNHLVSVEAQDFLAGQSLSRGQYPILLGRHHRLKSHRIDRPQGTADFLLIHCLAGRGWYQSGGVSQQIGPATAVLIPPGVPHVYGANSEAPWDITWVHFTGPHAAELAGCLGPLDAVTHFRTVESDRLLLAFEETVGLFRGGVGKGHLLAGAAGFLRYLTLMNLNRREAGSAAGRTEERILESVRYLHQQPAERHTLETLAHRAALSVPHYVALFRQETGLPPMRYLAHLRMQQACLLLDTTSDSVGEIAQAIGFEDQYFFSRQFRKIIGVPPSHYRQLTKG